RGVRKPAGLKIVANPAPYGDTEHSDRYQLSPRQLVKKFCILNKSKTSRTLPGLSAYPGPCWRTSPQTPGEARGALVDAALPADEPVQGLGIQLVRCCVSHYPRPFAPRSFVGLSRVGRSPNDRGKRVFPLRPFQPL